MNSHLIEKFFRKECTAEEAKQVLEWFSQQEVKFWQQEWAMVAKPFATQNLKGYHDALSKFYGGEMTCAGMLYSPVIGACFPTDPKLAYDLALFDLGYARDMTTLVGAMVAAGFE